MKYIFTILLMLFLQAQAFAWTYHSIYDLQGNKVYENKDASVDYYNKECIVLKDSKGYYFSFPNGKRSKYYSVLKKLPMSEIYFIAQTPEMKGKADVLNNQGKLVIPYKNYYYWDYIYTNDNKLIVYDEKENKPYIIDKNGTKTAISENRFQQEHELQEKRKEAFSVEHKVCKKYNNTFRGRKYFTYEENGLWGVRDYSDKLILKPVFKNMIKIVDDYIYEIEF